MNNTLVAKISGFSSSGFQHSFTITSVSTSSAVPEPKSLRLQSASNVNEFGSYTGLFVAYGEYVDKFVIAQPLEMDTYWSQNGYTAISRDFENVIGFGRTAHLACSDALTHLIHLRQDYGSLKEEEATRKALRLRDRLNTYFKSVRS
jgi:hypothetical protein